MQRLLFRGIRFDRIAASLGRQLGRITDVQVGKPDSDFGDRTAERGVGSEKELADEELALVSALVELIEQSVLDLEFAHVGDEIGDAKRAIATLDLPDEQAALKSDHSVVSPWVGCTTPETTSPTGKTIPTG
jgi:hypothetical protein